MAQPALQYEESVRRMTPVTAPEDQREGVVELLRLVRDIGRTEEPAVYKLVSPDGTVTAIPESVFLLLERVVEVLARGDAITVVPVGKELTTQQAADILNVSRQYLVRLLDRGKIPFHKTGTHRRVRMEDLLDYKRVREQEQMSALDELTRISQELGGYDEVPKGD